MGWRRLAGGLLVALTCTACGDADAPADWEDKGPGSKAWGDPEVTCATTEDCAEGEVCQDGICQMERCTDAAYESVAPLGHTRYFAIDREIMVVGDQTYVDGYESEGGGYLASWDLQGAKILDVAGGDLLGARPHAIAAAIEFSEKIKINTGEEERELDVGIWPESLAVGDTDGDGIDELVVLGKDGSISLCHVLNESCLVATLEGAAGKSAAVADVDGDGFEEPIFLADIGGKSVVVVWNADSDKTGQEQTVAWNLDDWLPIGIDLTQVAAGDLDGDGIAEVVVLEDQGLWGYELDMVHVFSAVGEPKLLSSLEVSGVSIDIAAGDRDGDGKAEVMLLRDDAQFELLAADTAGVLKSSFVAPLAVGTGASRIATVDWDGDSVSGRLVGGPDLVAGNMIPVALMLFPPYSEIYQGGVGSVTLGDTKSQSESVSDTVSLHLGLTVGWGGDLGKIIKAGVNGYFIKDYASTKSVTKGMAVGTRWSIDANPTLYGDDYGGVVLSCGCFHQYQYETVDPANKAGGSGKQIGILVPVGGQTGIWSSKRYNAVAERLGGLPLVNIPYQVGSIEAYPSEHQTLAGGPIADEDRLFVSPPTYQASDVGSVSWFLSLSESESNTQAETTTIGGNASVGAFGVTFTFDYNQGYSHAYTLSVGTEALFAGAIPPMQDNPDTPEDEYELNRYSFAPMVYREHYADAAGEDAGYYVITYAVGK